MINEILQDYLANFPREKKKISIAIKQAKNTKNESNGFEWVDLDLFLKQEHFNSIIPKIYAIIFSKERTP